MSDVFNGEVVVANRPEWIAEEGFVNPALMPAEIKLPARVAEALRDADRKLHMASFAISGLIGSFSEPLAVHVLAGRRTMEDNAIIVPSMGLYNFFIRNPGRYSKKTHNPLYNVDSMYSSKSIGPNTPCLSRVTDHTSGLDVDVAPIYAESRRLLMVRHLYGASFYKDEPPRTCPSAVKLGYDQMSAVEWLLNVAMQKAGFTQPDAQRAPWHFRFNEKT